MTDREIAERASRQINAKWTAVESDLDEFAQRDIPIIQAAITEARAEDRKLLRECKESLEDLALCGYSKSGTSWVDLQVSEADVIDGRALIAKIKAHLEVEG